MPDKKLSSKISLKNDSKARNGKVEFLRFLFCFIVLLYHIAESTIGLKYEVLENITFFGKGYFSVEFFFIVSGYLMASTAFKNQENGLQLASDTLVFMKRKLMSVLSYHLIVFSVTFIGVAVFNSFTVTDLVRRFIDSLPNLLLIQRSGLYNVDVLGVEWYISDMLMAMFILYPICKRYYHNFTKIIAPIISLLIVGYLIKETGKLSGSTAWSVLVSKTLLRAIAEICAGATLFEIARYLKKLNLSKVDKIILTILEVGSYLAVIGYIIVPSSRKYDGTFLIFMCIGICLSFAQVTFGNRIFNNKFCLFLGKITLPIYLCQSLVRRLTTGYVYETYGFVVCLVVSVIGTFAFAFISMFIEKYLRKFINNKLEQLSIKKQ